MQVRLAPGVQLLPAQIELLVQAFADAQTIFVKREFRSGYSGALVLLVSLGADRAPVVVKLAHPRDLQREYEAYQQFVRQISPQNIAHLQGEPLINADGQLGLIQYSFAGGETNLPAASLRDYYESKGGEASAGVLNRIFRAFGRYWWANNRPHLYTLGEQYDRLLPVHLQVTNAEAGDEPITVLENGKTSVLALRSIGVGHFVRLVGFEVNKVGADGTRMTLIALPPPNEASSSLRVRFESDESVGPLPYKPGDVVEVLDAVVVATRQTLLQDAAVTALPSFDPNVKNFTADIGRMASGLENFSLINPLYELSELLNTVVETKTSVIHGDLNLQNVLVDTPTGFAWIIDFGETRHGPTLLDLQRLEVQVITKLLPPIWSQAQFALADLVNLLVSLHTDSLPPSPPHPAMLEPYRVLVTIRRLARQYLIDDLNWDEYYYGLVVALVGALKYDELESLARSLALVAAATADGLVGRRLTIDHQPAQVSTSRVAAVGALPDANSEPPPAAQPVPAATSTRRYLGIGIAVFIALLAAIMTWQLWPTPQSGPSAEGTQSPSASVAETPSAASGEATASLESSAPTTTSELAASETSESVATSTTAVAANSTVVAPAITSEAVAAAEPVTSAVAEDATSSGVNSIEESEFVQVPEGEFTMGTEDGAPDTQPAHTVYLDEYWIMRTEVTNAQYGPCVEAGACTPPQNERWNDSQYADYPVTDVTWQQADEFAQWAGRQLPTEAQWEKAARGTDGRVYPWGDDITGDTQLNYDSPTGDVVAVASYPEGASFYGALDMAGNVEEWVADWYAPDYYANSPEEEPAGPDEGVTRVLRGGSYLTNRRAVRATSRAKAPPDAHFSSVGFRLVMDPNP